MSCPFGFTAQSDSNPADTAQQDAAILATNKAAEAGDSEALAAQTSRTPTKEERPYYSTYLGLEKILSAGVPESLRKAGKLSHDEILFITVHQTYELWFKQILVELDSIRTILSQPQVDEKDIYVIVSRLERIVQIQKLLVEQIGIVETMTPQSFLEFRDLLAPASGFQSWQFREIEVKLGLEPTRTYQNVPIHSFLNEEHQKHLTSALERPTAIPSLLRLVEKWLERTPFLEIGDFTFWKTYQDMSLKILKHEEQTIEAHPFLSKEDKAKQLKNLESTKENYRTILDESVHNELIAQGRRRLSHRATLGALFIYLYREEPLLQLPFKFLSLLCDIDEYLSLWRYRHLVMVQRMIGHKMGTGGSSGFAYLQKTTRDTNYQAFTDLYNLSTFLLPRSYLPPLPEQVTSKLRFTSPPMVSPRFAVYPGFSDIPTANGTKDHKSENNAHDHTNNTAAATNNKAQ